MKQKILEIRKQPEFDTVNVMHFRDILVEKYGINVSYSCLYNFLSKNNIKSPRKHRKTKVHHRRNRRGKAGELLQIDAIPHEFFVGDKNKYTLHGLIDDATVFTTKKDKLTIEEQLSGIEEPNTQFGKIMNELVINLIHAGSSQAKGRIERLWNTLHDRLITEFKINHITNMDDANIFLKDYIKKYNKKFKVKPKDNKKAFIPLLKSINLDLLLTVKYKRTVDNGACFSLNNVSFKIQNIDILPRTRIDVLIL